MYYMHVLERFQTKNTDDIFSKKIQHTFGDKNIIFTKKIYFTYILYHVSTYTISHSHFISFLIIIYLIFHPVSSYPATFPYSINYHLLCHICSANALSSLLFHHSHLFSSGFQNRFALSSLPYLNLAITFTSFLSHLFRKYRGTHGVCLVFAVISRLSVPCSCPCIYLILSIISSSILSFLCSPLLI